MAFSDWQTKRLRTRLRTYREQQGRRDIGRPLPWKTVATRIEMSQELKFDFGSNGERLRQFVEGVPVEAGSPERRPRAMEDYRLEAVRDFLTQPKVGFLRLEELNEESAPLHAGLALRDYFHGLDVSGDTPGVDAGGLEGTFEGVSADSEITVHRRLTVKARADDGLYELEEQVVNYSSPAINMPFSEWPGNLKHRNRRSKQALAGWAAASKDGAIFMFVADLYDRSLCSHFVFQREATVPGQPVNSFLVFHYGPQPYFGRQPVDPQGPPDRTLAVIGEKHLVHFTRAGDERP